MRAVIAGGGTGGHLYPGIAIAAEIVSREPDNRVLFIGTRRGIEEKIVPMEGFDIRFIKIEGFVNVGIAGKIRTLAAIPGAVSESKRILGEFDPHVVIGVGGYASGPAVIGARCMGFPTMIQEQNAMPGLANRILGRLVDTVAITYPDSRRWFDGEKTVFTGNPVRSSIGAAERKDALASLGLEDGRFTVLVLGGSRGAHSINMAMLGALDRLDDIRWKLQIIHQTGSADEAAVKEAYRKRSMHGVVSAFMHEMAQAYAAADLVICRAGASTLAEVSACGKASVLVPYPYAARNHQEINARKVFEMGACRVIHDADLTGAVFASTIRELYENRDDIAAMERASKSLGKSGAARHIVDLAYELCRRKGVL